MSRYNETDPKNAGARFIKEYLEFTKGKNASKLPKMIFCGDEDAAFERLKEHGVTGNDLPKVTVDEAEMMAFCLEK